MAAEERPGPVHLELPEDVAGEEASEEVMVPPLPVELPVAHPAALDRAAEMIRRAERPLVMLGAAASRPRLEDDLGRFLARLRIPFFTTQMGKGFSSQVMEGGVGGSAAHPIDLWMGTAALSERDYVHTAIDQADLIITIGHDTVEKPPFIDGSGWADGDSCGLFAGECGGGVFSAGCGGG